MVLPTLAAAGMETVTADLGRSLREAGHEVGFTCLEADGALGDGLRAEGIRVDVVPTPGLQANFRAPALATHFARVAPDVVHVHSGVWAKAARAARAADVPRVIHTVHGLLDQEPWHGPALKRWAMRHTDAVTTVSEPLRDYLVQRVGIPASRTHVLPNGIDTDRFSPGPRQATARAWLGVPNDALLIGTVARLTAVKNQVLLLESFATIAHRHPTAHLVIIGEGELRAPLVARARAAGLADRVHFPGASQDVAPLYRALDVFVLCSTAEGTSISMLEAMSSGVAIVGTAVGGTPHLLAHGDCGILVPSEHVARLSGAIDALLTAAPLRAAIGAAARARAVAHFDRRVMRSAFERLYRGIASERTP